MSVRPTKEQVWKLSSEHAEFSAQMPEGSRQREAVRPFIEASVDVLEDMFDAPVTLQALADAKVRFLRYCVNNGLGKVMADAMAEVMSIDEGMITGMFTQLIDMLEPMLADINTFLDSQGVTEEQVMMSPQVGLNMENQKAWKSGTLTIADVLNTQPEVILQNKS